MATALYSPGPSQENRYVGSPQVAKYIPPPFSENAQKQIARIDQLAGRDLGPAMSAIEKSIALMKTVAQEQAALNRVGEIIGMMTDKLNYIKPMIIHSAGKRRRTNKKRRSS
jgi:hypothetical protein